MTTTPLFQGLNQETTQQYVRQALDPAYGDLASVVKPEDSAASDAGLGIPPLFVRGPASAPTAQVDAVGDYIRGIATAEGKQVVALNSDPNLYWQYASAALAATTAVISMKSAAGSTVKNYLTDIEMQLVAAVSGGLSVQIKQGSTIIATHNFVGTAGETWTRSLRTPHFSANNAAITATLSAAATINLDATGFAGV